MNYYIFRHAATFATKYYIPYGSKIRTAEILPEGIPATERLAKYLKDINTDANFTSPFLRCKQTVEIVEKITDKKFKDDKRLGEYIEGYTNFKKFSARIKDFIDETESKNYKDVAICTHGGDIAAIKNWVLKGSFHIWNLIDYPRPGVIWIIKNGKVKEINFNK